MGKVHGCARQDRQKCRQTHPIREYAWQQKLRFDYTPEDCKSFAAAIEQVVVPAATRIYEKRKKALGLDTLRPWDLVDGWFNRPTPASRHPPLKPFTSMDELKQGASAIFHKVDPVLGGYFDTMLAEGLTDLENRKNKAPGAYCTSYTSIRKPFVFVNAVGIHDDVMTTLHESGHAFHVFETARIPYIQQLAVPMEFAEVASMGMELLASPYLTKKDGGFYSEAEAARARIEHLESDDPLLALHGGGGLVPAVGLRESRRRARTRRPAMPNGVNSGTVFCPAWIGADWKRSR